MMLIDLKFCTHKINIRSMWREEVDKRKGIVSKTENWTTVYTALRRREPMYRKFMQ
jgi:hypothetical protein